MSNTTASWWPRHNSLSTIPLYPPGMADFANTMASDAAEAVSRWLAALKSARRASALTLEAYARDLGQFARFLMDHLGAPAAIADLETLSTSDFRAFLARRRHEGA